MLSLVSRAECDKFTMPIIDEGNYDGDLISSMRTMKIIETVHNIFIIRSELCSQVCDLI